MANDRKTTLKPITAILDSKGAVVGKALNTCKHSVYTEYHNGAQFIETVPEMTVIMSFAPECPLNDDERTELHKLVEKMLVKKDADAKKKPAGEVGSTEETQ